MASPKPRRMISTDTNKEQIPVARSFSPALRIPAMIISYLLHPVFIPSLITFMVYKLSPASFAGLPPARFYQLLLSVFLLTAFFPIVATLLTKAVGFIESIHLHTAKDRIIPLIGTMVFYFWAHHVAKNINAPFMLQLILLAAFWGVIAVFMINIFVKISMHTTGAGSLLGILIILMFNSPVNMSIPFFIALVVAGLIGTARMILNAHLAREIWLGYIIGILVQVAAYFYLV